MTTPIRFAAWIDASASAASLAMAIWLHHIAKVAVDEVVAKYGRNVGSGVYELATANWYFLPACAVLGDAAVAIFRSWAWRRAIHWLAWLLVLLPIGWLVVSEVSRGMA
jgi:hypothetical protein